MTSRPPASAKVDASGEFHLDGLPAGDYVLVMSSEPGTTAPASVNVTVVANQRAKVKLVMSNGSVRLVVKVTGGTRVGVSLAPRAGRASRGAPHRMSRSSLVTRAIDALAQLFDQRN